MEQQFSGVLVQRDETNLVNHNKLYLFQRTQVVVQGPLGVLLQQDVCQLRRSKEADTPPLLAGFQSNSRSQMGLSRPNAPHKNQVFFWGKEMEVGHVFLCQAARKFNGGVPHKIIQCLHHPETSRLYHAVNPVGLSFLQFQCQEIGHILLGIFVGDAPPAFRHAAQLHLPHELFNLFSHEPHLPSGHHRLRGLDCSSAMGLRRV